MFKTVESKHFSAEPCYFKDKLHLSRINESIYSLIYIEKTEIDELIKLLQDAKMEFR